MGRKLVHMLISLIIILKEPNMPEAFCRCPPSSPCRCVYRDLPSIPQDLPTSISHLLLSYNHITSVNRSELLPYRNLIRLDLAENRIGFVDSFPNLLQLQNLNLEKNKITEIHSGTFSNLPQLLELSLSTNQISDIAADAFANLHWLKKLDLSSNQITIIQSDIFANLQVLKELFLNFNNITTIQSGAFATLTQLEVLWLCQNQITKIQFDTFANVTKLYKLDLSYNQIKAIQTGLFANLRSLEWLYLQSNKITKIQAGLFANLTQLEVLYLNNNQITMIESGTFANLPRLTSLELRSNKIRNIQPGTLVHLSHLKEVWLCSNQISVIQSVIFSKLIYLRQLMLHQNQITLIQAGAVENLPWLSVLFLHSNNIITIKSGAFRNLPKLEIVMLGYNQITTIESGAFSNLSQLLNVDLRSNRMIAISPLEYGWLPSIRFIQLANNPWHCDCRMIPFRLNTTEFPTFKDQIICAQPSKFQGKKLADVKPEELICDEPTIFTSSVNIKVSSNGCYDGDATYRHHWYFTCTRNADSTAGLVGKTNKPKPTLTSLLAITSDKPRRISPRGSAPIPLIPVLIGSVWGPVAGIVLIIITVRYKKIIRNLLFGPDRNVRAAGRHTNNAVSVMNSGHDHEYEDIDNHRVKTGQGLLQSQAITESDVKTTAAVMASGQDPTGQGQSQAITETTTKTTSTVMASGHDNQYDDIDNHRVKTGQGQFRAIAKSRTKTTATIMTSGQDQTGHGQSQAITESTSKTTATIITSGHGYETTDNHNVKTGQDQSQAITESLDVENISYGIGPNTSQLPSLYHVATPPQAITESNTNITDALMTSSHDQTDHVLSQAMTESLYVENISYGTGPTTPQLPSLYQVATPPQAITESNTNITDALMTSSHDQIGHVQSQASTESLDAINIQYGRGTASSRPNSLY
ncbi:uncharacterized protein LOC144913934 [Branchiostoma floridae x Branchiostoma belcheri]